MTGDARSEILDRIRRAGPITRPAVPRDYVGAGGHDADPVADLALFAERVADYRAGVHRCTAATVAATVAGVLHAAGRRRVLTPPGFPADHLDPVGLDLVTDEGPLPADELDTLDAVVTTCAVAIAVTGTVVLDHGEGQGRRALTLVPDHHVVVVSAGRVVHNVPDAVAALDPDRPQTWISGPSATSDIELQRVEGVHGPRTLDVVLIEH